ncbi:MAG: hypothetical protein CMJ31_15085 [Phycisphaerae bacterium]|nr:hypothetical protein [Phycisphaerae bacterium]
MTPWFLAGAIDVSWKARRAATMLGELGARRGVAVDAVGRVVGAVDAITLLADPSSVVADRLEPVGELADGITIRDALVILSHNGAKIGVVVDSGGSPIGVVTIEDLLAPLIRSGDKE